MPLFVLLSVIIIVSLVGGIGGFFWFRQRKNFLVLTHYNNGVSYLETGEYPKAVEELVPNLLSLGGVQKVLQNLLQEKVSIRDMLTIVETLADYTPLTKDPDLLTEYVRHKLSRSIISPYIGEDGVLKLITMAQEVEDILIQGIQKTDVGQYLSVDPKVAEPIINAIKEEAEKAMAKNIQPILHFFLNRFH